MRRTGRATGSHQGTFGLGFPSRPGAAVQALQSRVPVCTAYARVPGQLWLRTLDLCRAVAKASAGWRRCRLALCCLPGWMRAGWGPGFSIVGGRESKPKQSSGMRITRGSTLQPCTDPRTPLEICRPGNPKIPNRAAAGTPEADEQRGRGNEDKKTTAPRSVPSPSFCRSLTRHGPPRQERCRQGAATEEAPVHSGDSSKQSRLQSRLHVRRLGTSCVVEASA